MQAVMNLKNNLTCNHAHQQARHDCDQCTQDRQVEVGQRVPGVCQRWPYTNAWRGRLLQSSVILYFIHCHDYHLWWWYCMTQATMNGFLQVFSWFIFWAVKFRLHYPEHMCLMTENDSLGGLGQSHWTGPGSCRCVVLVHCVVAAHSAEWEGICLFSGWWVNLASNPHPQSQH